MLLISLCNSDWQIPRNYKTPNLYPGNKNKIRTAVFSIAFQNISSAGFMHILFHRYHNLYSWWQKKKKKIFRQLWYGYHVKSPSFFLLLKSLLLLSTSKKPLFSMLSNLSIFFLLTKSLRLSGNSCQCIWSGEREDERQGRQGLFFSCRMEI